MKKDVKAIKNGKILDDYLLGKGKFV